MRLFSLFLSGLVAQALFAQTPKAVVVEHFTNSRCSICALRNPTFNATMALHPEVLRLTFHPSSPYSNCYFSQQNPTENDNRTKFYSAYGGTPRLALQGKLRSGNNPLVPDSALVNAAGQTTFLDIKLTLTQVTDTDFAARVKVFRTGAGDASGLTLLACLSETEVAYNAPNGESLHRNVFLKALTPVAGQALNIGEAVGDSISQTFFFTKSSNWGDDLELTALVQGSNKALVQAGRTTEIAIATAAAPSLSVDIQVYPNPFADQVVLVSLVPFRYHLISGNGVVLASGLLAAGEHPLDVSRLAPGWYCLSTDGPTGQKSQMLLKQ